MTLLIYDLNLSSILFMPLVSISTWQHTELNCMHSNQSLASRFISHLIFCVLLLFMCRLIVKHLNVFHTHCFWYHRPVFPTTRLSVCPLLPQMRRHIALLITTSLHTAGVWVPYAFLVTEIRESINRHSLLRKQRQSCQVRASADCMLTAWPKTARHFGSRRQASTI